MTSPTRNEINYMWPAGTCVMVGDSIITRIDEIRLSKNRLVRLPDFRGATLEDISHYIIPILKRHMNVTILNKWNKSLHF